MMRYFPSLFLALLVTAGGCKRDTQAPSPAPQEDPPAHSGKVPADHGKKVQPPPPSPERAAAAETLELESATLVVSDVEIPLGGAGTAHIELVPKSPWTLNLDYPTRVTLSGFLAAVPVRLEFTAGEPDSGLQLTTGGLRHDIALQADQPGEDRVTARIRYGTCTAEACRLHTHEASFRVSVTTPPP